MQDARGFKGGSRRRENFDSTDPGVCPRLPKKTSRHPGARPRGAGAAAGPERPLDRRLRLAATGPISIDGGRTLGHLGSRSPSPDVRGSGDAGEQMRWIVHSSRWPEDVSCRCRPGAVWRLRHSLWMLAPFLGLGIISWAGFVYIAARTRRVGLGLLAAGFVVAGVVGGVWLFGAPTSTETGLEGLFFLFLWAAAVTAALVVNPTYLAWRWRAQGRCRCGLAGATQPRGGYAGAPARAQLPLIQDRLPQRPASFDPRARS